jgi:glutathione S-transferase
MIVLHQFEISPFCDKVRRILHWKRQPYEVREIPVGQASFRVKRIHPAGKLPCLEESGRIVADSTDIAYYLEQRFPEPPLIPSDPKLRALTHLLEDWADESLYFYEMRMRFTFPHNARRWTPVLMAQDPPWLRRAAGLFLPRFFRSVLDRQGLGRKPDHAVVHEASRHVAALAGWLADREWLVGDALTLADIAVFAQLFCIRGAEEGAKLVEAQATLAAWMERVDRATAKPT